MSARLYVLAFYIADTEGETHGPADVKAALADVTECAIPALAKRGMQIADAQIAEVFR